MKQLTQLFAIFIIACLTLTGLNSCNNDDDSSMPCENDLPSVGDNVVWEYLLGFDTMVPALPDAYSNYFAYSFARTSDDIGIRINGEFADARYMSFNLYDVWVGNSTAAILDKDMSSKACSYNHFASEAEEPNKRYSVNIVPIGTDTSRMENPMTYDPGIDSLSVFIRYYVPVGTFGEVPLPSVEAFNINTGEILDRPEPFDLIPDFVDIDELTELVDPLFSLETPNVIRFYNGNSGGLYPNEHNHYIAAPITKKDDEVYMIRFLAPTYVTDDSEIGTKDMRYFSINQGGVNTRNYSGIHDSQFIIAQDGYITLVIADDTAELREKAEGLNFTPWSLPEGDDQMVLLYRNLVINEAFQFGTNSVPKLDRDNPIIEQAANFYMGDYAPIGLKMSVEDYLEDFGGFPVSY